jgi:hypothetical protein
LDAYSFDFDAISGSGLNGGVDLSQYDIFVCQSSLSSVLGQAGTAALESFFNAGGDYIGIGSAGADVSIQFLSPGVEYSTSSGNGIVRVAHDPDDPVSAQYPADSFAVSSQ